MNLDKWNKEKHRLKFDEKSHKYFWDNQEIKGSVSSVIAPLSPYKTMDVDPNVLQNAGIRGTMVHKWIEDDINKEPLFKRKMIESYQPYINAYLEWKSLYTTRFDILISELQLYHPIHKFGGTIDAIVYDNKTKKYGILDFKTNSVQIDDLVTTQTMGYNYLINYWIQDVKIEKAYVLYLTKHGTFQFKAIDVNKGKRLFDKCLKEWKEDE